MKVFKKLKPRIINYRNYKHFSNEMLLNKLSQEVFVTTDDNLQRFCYINTDVLNKYVSRKKKHAWGDQMPFITKYLSKSNNEQVKTP